MEAMGFGRPEIDRALRAAFFNPDRAIEYLLNGIPADVLAEQRQPPAAAAAGAQATPASPPAGQPTQPAQTSGDEPVNLFEAAAQANQGRGGATRSGAGAGAGAGAAGTASATAAGGQMDLDYLRQSPQFQQLRQLVQQQPSMLEPILQQVAEGNPQLAQMIALNPEQFLQLLAEVRTADCAIPSDITVVNLFAGQCRRCNWGHGRSWTAPTWRDTD
jgi:UV excision repair protein RAD23